MKILMLLETDFPPDPRVESELIILKDEGHDIIVICPTSSGKKLYEEIQGVKVYRKRLSGFISKSSVGALRFPFYHKFWMSFCRSVLKLEKEIDVIHAHDLSMAPVGLKLKKILDVPLILDLHENYPFLIKDALHVQSFLGKCLTNFKEWKRFERLAVHKSDKVLTVVQEMKERIIEVGKNEQDVFVYQNVSSLDLIDFDETKEVQSIGGFNLVYAGGITPARGLLTVVEAISLLSEDVRKNFVLTICGVGIYKEFLEKRVIELGISQYVHFVGWVPQEDVYKYIKRGDATIIPHYRSVQNDCSSPNKLFQYMSLGLPIICSNCRSLERVITEENCGLIYEDRSASQLKGRIEELMSNVDLRKKLGYNGISAVREKYNRDIEKYDLIDLYEKLNLH